MHFNRNKFDNHISIYLHLFYMIKTNQKRKRSLAFRKLEIFRNKYSSVLDKIIKLKNIFELNKDSIFFVSCKNILSKKLYSLGLIENINNLNQDIITINSIKKRTIKCILFKNKLVKSILEAIKMIKEKKVYIGSVLVLNHNILINREMEKIIKIIK